MREALRHLLLENQMSYASHTSYPQKPIAKSNAPIKPTHQQAKKGNIMKLKVN